jgi:hypothetical protein
MKTKIYAAIATVAVSLGVAMSANATSLSDLSYRDTRVTVTLANTSNITIREMYLSTVNSTVWGRDLLGSDQMAINSQWNVKTPAGRYDLKLVDSDRDVCILRDVYIGADQEVNISNEALLRCEGY